jgi:hypothetical protein
MRLNGYKTWTFSLSNFLLGYMQPSTIIMASTERINPVSKTGSYYADDTRANSLAHLFAALRLDCITQENGHGILSYIPPTKSFLGGPCYQDLRAI